MLRIAWVLMLVIPATGASSRKMNSRRAWKERLTHTIDTTSPRNYRMAACQNFKRSFRFTFASAAMSHFSLVRMHCGSLKTYSSDFSGLSGFTSLFSCTWLHREPRDLSHGAQLQSVSVVALQTVHTAWLVTFSARWTLTENFTVLQCSGHAAAQKSH